MRCGQTSSTVPGVTAISVLLVALAGCGTDDPAASQVRATDLSPEVQRLVEAAEQDGALSLNWALNNSRTMEPLVDAFRAAYELELEVTVTPAPGMPANLAQLVEEHNAGRDASTDVYVGTQDFLLAGGPEGSDIWELVEWEQVAPHVTELAVADGAGVSLLDQIPGFTYHTELVAAEDLPTTTAEVLALDQPLASTPYAAIFNLLSAEDLLGRSYIEDHLRQFEPAGLINCLELDRIASGEFAGLWMACGGNLMEIAAADGAPLGHVVPRDAGVVQTWYMAVPEHAAHPDAAKLWVSWLATPQAQRILFEYEYADNRLVDGSRTAAEIAEYEADGVSFAYTDYEWVQAHPEVSHSDFVQELGGLLQGEG